MANGADATRRTDRGTTDHGSQQAFSEAQRIWLLERDLDDSDQAFHEFRTDVNSKLNGVTLRMNWLVGIAFLLLVSVVSVLVTVIASR